MNLILISILIFTSFIKIVAKKKACREKVLFGFLGYNPSSAEVKSVSETSIKRD